MDLISGVIRIMGKGGRERYIQISDPSVLRILRKYYYENENEIREKRYFFVNQIQAVDLPEQSIRIMIRKHAKIAGIENRITPHMFRHSFATYLIEEGVDVSCV